LDQEGGDAPLRLFLLLLLEFPLILLPQQHLLLLMPGLNRQREDSISIDRRLTASGENPVSSRDIVFKTPMILLGDSKRPGVVHLYSNVFLSFFSMPSCKVEIKHEPFELFVITGNKEV
jgi:hypothetical protein